MQITFVSMFVTNAEKHTHIYFGSTFQLSKVVVVSELNWFYLSFWYRGPQAPGHGPVPGCGSFDTGPHRKEKSFILKYFSISISLHGILF